MDSPDSSRPQSASVDNGTAASNCSLPTNVLLSNVSVTQHPRAPLSTVAVQAVFHKYRPLGKASTQSPLQQSVGSTSCIPPTNIVPPRTPLAAAASPATAAAENVNPQEHRDDDGEDDPNSRSEMSRDWATDHVCHPRDAVFLPSLGREQGVPQVQRGYGPGSFRGAEKPSGVGNSSGFTFGRTHTPSGQVGLEPTKCVPETPPTQRSQPSPIRRQPTLGDKTSANVSSGGPFGSKPSDYLVDSSPIQSNSQPMPGRLQTVRINQEGNNGPWATVGPKHSKYVPDTSLTQNHTTASEVTDETQNRPPDSSSTQRLQSARAFSPQPSALSRDTMGSSGGIPKTPPPPPPSPGKLLYKDPACDPDNPFILQFRDVTSAAFMIRNAITVTPCVHSRLSRVCGMDIFLKKDFMQLTGSFKERGARYALLMLTPEQKATGIVAASLGNHALALACHGAQLGIPVTVVMPFKAPLSKVSACRVYGANVIIDGDNMGEARNIALDLTYKKGLTYINGYDHPHVLAGQGTLGLELLEQVCDVDAIVIPVGGGGLLAGVARAAKTMYPAIKIIVCTGIALDRGALNRQMET